MSRQTAKKSRSEQPQPASSLGAAQVSIEPTSPPIEAPGVPAVDVGTDRSILRKRVIVALVIGSIWWLALVAMWLLTANPVTLNVEQLRAATYIVTAVVNDVASGKVTVEKEWKSGEKLDSITIANLNETIAENGDKFLIPITMDADRSFSVTQSKAPDSPWLIYPDRPQTYEQLERVLPEALKPAPAHEFVPNEPGP